MSTREKKNDANLKICMLHNTNDINKNQCDIQNLHFSPLGRHYLLKIDHSHNTPGHFFSWLDTPIN